MPASQVRIPIEGELTIFTAQENHQRLLEALRQASDIEVDLSQVAEIDGAGLQLMVSAKHAAVAAGKTLRFTGHSPAVLDLIDLANLAGFFGDPMIIQNAEAVA